MSAGNARLGREHADEIERIGGGDGDELAVMRLAAHVAQQANGFGRGELLA